MRILNTEGSAQLKFKAKSVCVIILLFALCGCGAPADPQSPEYLAQESQAYYQKAIARYKDLIDQGKDADRLRIDLGRLYAGHGDFTEAAEEFIKSNDPLAQKLLAIAYYRMGRLTDALEIFNKQESGDDEYIWYKGLTSEKLNLFDQAIEAFRNIKDARFSVQAAERIEVIERLSQTKNISEADPVLARSIAGAPSSEAYPQAGALILSCDEQVEVAAEGTEISTLHYVVKILNERGKESFSEAQIDYDSTYEKVELVSARTIKPDGTTVQVGSRHIRDVSKYLNFPLYSNARVYIISFPEISQGAVIEYTVKIYDSQLINKKDFVLDYGVQASEPIIRADFTVSLPKERALHIKYLNQQYNDFGAVVEPQKDERGIKTVFSWRFKDIPQIISESNMPSQAKINPTIRLSTFASWQEVYDWWWKLARDKIKADSAIKNKVGELTSRKSTDEAKIQAIYNFVVQEIRYVAIEYGQAGYEPHKAEDTFRNKYGDCKDKAILLITMLKEAGFTAWPVLISTKENYDLDEDLPSMSFNHAIAAMPFKGQTVFMDGTAETCSFGDLPEGDQERKVLVFTEEGFRIEKTPLYPAAHNVVKQELAMRVNSDETIGAEKTIFSSGIYNQGQRYWFLYTQPELIKEQLKEKVQEISIGGTLSDYAIDHLDDLSVPVVLKYSFKGPEYFTPAGTLRIMPQLASIDTALVAKDTRRYPIDLGALDRKETVFEIALPRVIGVKYLPESIVEDSPWVSFSAEYSRKNNTIYFRQTLETKKSEVSAREYPEFKKFIEGVAKRVKQRIVLEKVQ